MEITQDETCTHHGKEEIEGWRFSYFSLTYIIDNDDLAYN